MKERQSHDSLVKELIGHFLEKNLEVRLANCEGYNKPMVIKRHPPDILAVDSSGLVHIGVVKMCSSLGDQMTREQFEDFSKRLMKNSDSQKIRVPLFIAVPTDCQAKVREMFRQFEIPWKENIQVIGF